MTKAVSIAQSGTNNVTMRNRILNGSMMIDQRNAGALITNPTNQQFLVDRWQYESTQTGKVNIQQNYGSVTPPAGFTNYLGVVSNSAYSIGAGDIFDVRQVIEGLNVSDLGWGTANAATVTLSFKVYSSLTGIFGGVLKNSNQDRSYPFTYTVSSANTWTSVSVTIAGDTSGTWLTTNGAGIRVVFGLGVGSTYSGTAGSWAGASYYSATGATSVVGTNGATFYITGVQLEAGTTATPFEQRLYGTELALCQRYYFYTADGRFSGYVAGGSDQAQQLVIFPATMRAAPTVTLSTSGYSGDNNVSTLSAGNTTPQSFTITASKNPAGYFYSRFSTTANIEL
jgi:hypothetical protein